MYDQSLEVLMDEFFGITEERQANTCFNDECEFCVRHICQLPKGEEEE